MSRLYAPLANLGQQFEPSKGIYLYSDFSGNIAPFCICTGTSGSPNSSTFTMVSSMTTKAFGELRLNLAASAGARIGVFASTCTLASAIGTFSNSTYSDSNVSPTTIDRLNYFTDMPYDFEARVQVVNLGGQYQRVGAGFYISHGPASTTNFVADGAAFVSTNNGEWKCVVASSNVQVETSTGYSATVYRRLRIKTDPNANLIQFYIDDQLVHSAAPTWDTANLGICWGVEIREKGSSNYVGGLVSIDYMKLEGQIQR